MKTFSTLLLTIALSVKAANHDGHDHDAHEGHDQEKGHKCACDAILYDFTIDCDNTQAVTDALAQLQALQCAQECHNEACEKNWLIVQSHHDHCPSDVLPVAVENGFHDYDRVCDLCDIVRMEIPGAPACPEVNCTDGSGNEAYSRLLTKNCNLEFQCTETNCKDDYLTLRMAHDSCEHGSLSEGAENGLHALEDPCASFVCNMPAQMIADTLICTEAELNETKAHHGEHDDHDDHDDHGDHDHSPTKAPSTTTTKAPTTDSGANTFAIGSLVSVMIIASLF